jgi:hypothetical protein
MHAPHIEHQNTSMAVLMLFGLPFVLILLLFVFKKTRPLAWTLLGLGGLAVFFLFGYWSLSVHHVNVAPGPVAQSWATTAEESYSVDVDAALGPRIQLDGRTVVTGDSAHVPHPAAPLEVNEAVEAAPPEPQDGAVAAPSESISSTAPESGPTRTAAVEPENASGEAPPPWVENPPPRDPDNYPVVIVTDPFPNKHEADRQLSRGLVIATSEVVSELVGDFGPPIRPRDDYGYGFALKRLRDMGLTPGEVRSKVWRDEHVEKLDLDLPTGEMVRVHALLEFDQAFQAELQSRWRRYQADQRMGIIGIFAAGVVGLLTIVWGTLTFDTATKGYYTKWLVAGAVLGAMALTFVVVASVA